MRTFALAVALIGAAPASAEVAAASDTGFTSRHVLTLAATPAKVWAALLHPERWWGSAHTYSGSAANLSLEPRPGGCWCEKTARGGVEHMRVVYLAANDTLRMTGGLGPLQAMPVTGVLTITLKGEGGGTRLTASYAVAGPGLANLAAPVDQVLGEQFAGLKATAER
ncbi:SRPBCC domain-containing protein [Sphingomonas psychrotolerans]|uniref:SRPBCC domain-containing protein n=1 Tax=Sphingomonas psychrotolerans TaxID=1327635 RepID=A0ABU3N2C5_9SPHN|nr:SRPBCC domain-containing protein [Sphingomonas psychrotolerans]MDT8758682.1 SRPBCC domain-containing protein [Sphingomonas psychrotolerans]